MKHPISYIVAFSILRNLHYLKEFPELKVVAIEDFERIVNGYTMGIQERLVTIIESECAELLLEKDGAKLFGFLRGRGIGLKSLKAMCDTMVKVAKGEIDPEQYIDMDRINSPTIYEALKDFKPFQ